MKRLIARILDVPLRALTRLGDAADQAALRLYFWSHRTGS